MERTISRVIILILFASLSSCAGCSKSGRESLRHESEKSTTEAPKRRSLRSESKKGIVPVERAVESLQATGGSRSVDSEHSKGNKLSQLYNQNRKGVFLVFATDDGETGAQGSGFFITSDGVGISNQHVFDSYHKQFIKTYDGKIYPVKSILDESHRSKLDFVIFKVDLGSEKVFPLKVSKTLPAIGEDVFAIGNPKGLEQTLSSGIVSAYRQDQNYIQTTTEITNGSSGGPLFNMNGEVVGITTSGVGEANLNFVVNIALLRLSRY